MADQPTIDIEEIARAFRVARLAGERLTVSPFAEWPADVQEEYRRVAREHLLRVRDVVDRMPCVCPPREITEPHTILCTRCSEMMALMVALAAGKPKG